VKVTGITATPFRDAAAPGGEACLVKLESDSGLNGIAIARAWARPAILALAKNLLLDADPRAVEAFWQRAGECMDSHADGALSHARAVLDVACWDLKARARDEPLWKALGGSRPRANAYFRCGAADAGADWTDPDLARAIAASGVRGAKLSVGLDPEAERQQLAGLHKLLSAVTHEPQLMVDAGRRWRPKAAIGHIRDLEAEFDLTWVQGVAEPGDFLGSRQVSMGIRSAVCAGGELISLGAFKAWFHHQAANVIEIDMHHFGITGAMQLADAAYGFELPVTLAAAPGNIHAHLASVMPYFMSMEIIPPEMGTGRLASDIRLEAGWAVAGDVPGLGLSVAPDRNGEDSREAAE